MSTILVLGAGVVGLSTAMMLARQGHSVTVLEKDSEPLPGSPEEAWRASERQGVTQFRLPHYLQPPIRQILDSNLPEVKEALLRADRLTFDVLTTMPSSITDRTAREGDERFITITGRRPAIEYAFASVTPWYHNTIEIDRAWIARFNALIEGLPEPQPANPRARIARALSVAMMYDPDLFRAANEMRSLLALPKEVMARPGLVDRILEVADTHEAVIAPGPSRPELVVMLA